MRRYRRAAARAALTLLTFGAPATLFADEPITIVLLGLAGLIGLAGILRAAFGRPARRDDPAQIDRLEGLLARLLEKGRGAEASAQERRRYEAVARQAVAEAAENPAKRAALAALAEGDLEAFEARFEEHLAAFAAAAQNAEQARGALAREHKAMAALAAPFDRAAARSADAKAVELDPSDEETALRLAESLMEAGDLAGAERLYADIAALETASPRGRHWAAIGTGDLAIQLGASPVARDAYLHAQAIAEAEHRRDPANPRWRYDLGIAHERIGDVSAAEGDVKEARENYQRKNDLITTLAAADPDNAGWKRDLSVSHEKIGDVLVAEGRLAEARASFEKSLALAEQLAAADPGDADWRRDLSVCQEKIGDVLVAEGRLAEARASFEKSRALREDLAAADPANAEWKRDLIVCYWKLAAFGDADAAAWRRQALAIAEALAADGRLAPADAWMVEDLRNRLAAAEGGAA